MRSESARLMNRHNAGDRWRVFVLESCNSLATAIYFFHLFFFTQKKFGFGDRENLALAASHGLVYAMFSSLGGSYGQRKGYPQALRIGFSIMGLCMFAGALVDGLVPHIALMLLWTFGMCFTWPSLEAMASQGANPAELPRRVGIYNMVWAVSCAAANFFGGALIEIFGSKSSFWIPVALHATQLLLLSLPSSPGLASPVQQPSEPPDPFPGLNPRPIARTRTFLHLSWVANPFAYIAINTVVPVIPTLAAKFGLSPAGTGFFCSIWYFARFAAFYTLWRWTGWHYRQGWFFLAYGMLLVGFLGLLLASQIWIVVISQVILGLALGLIYYSSLFYSMDAGDTHGEHGGFHEAAIGAGIFAGPAVGAISMTLMPTSLNAAVVAVFGLLVVGLAVLLVIRRRSGEMKVGAIG